MVVPFTVMWSQVVPGSSATSKGPSFAPSMTLSSRQYRSTRDLHRRPWRSYALTNSLPMIQDRVLPDEDAEPLA